MNRAQREAAKARRLAAAGGQPVPASVRAPAAPAVAAGTAPCAKCAGTGWVHVKELADTRGHTTKSLCQDCEGLGKGK